MKRVLISSGPTTVRSGRHGPFSQVDKSANRDADKGDLDQSVIVRDMQTPQSDASLQQVDPDLIVPMAPAPAPAFGRVEQIPASTEADSGPHVPARSFSDPMPLSLAQREESEMERRYLGRFGMELRH
jgi:hypothetical protein